jgi:hexokinase
MNPTWVMAFPTGYETGTFLALDMGGTNLRACEIVLTELESAFDITQSKYTLPQKSGALEVHRRLSAAIPQESSSGQSSISLLSASRSHTP